MRVAFGSVFLTSLIAIGAAAGSAEAQVVDFATCGTSPPLCSATTPRSSACCRETSAYVNAGAASGDKAILIPMDRCHQAITNSGVFSPPGAGAPGTDGEGWCADASPADANGMFYAYGLAYRLMQRGVPVFWLVNPTKSASTVDNYSSTGLSNQRYTDKDIDFWVMESGVAAIPTPPAGLTATGGSPPVSRLNSASTGLTVASSYTKKEFPLRGSAFLIAGSDTDGDGTTDRQEFNTFWATYGYGSSGRTCGNANDCYDFSAVALYQINSGARLMWRNYKTSTTYADEVPVAAKLDRPPPRIARVKPQGAVSTLWLKEANLNDPAGAGCERGAFSPSTAVFCDLTETDLLNNGLVAGNFSWAWFDGGSFTSCSKALQMVSRFLTPMAGFSISGNILVNDTSISDFEACTNWQPLGRQGAASAALDVQNGAVNESPDQPILIRYPTNLFAQYGDLPMDFASSSVSHWNSTTTRGYSTLFTGASNTLKRLLTREHTAAVGNTVCGDTSGNGTVATASPAADKAADAAELPHSLDAFPSTIGSSSACDVDPSTTANGDTEDLAAYGRFQNVVTNGVVFYLPGNSLSSASVRGELRLVLNALLATPSGYSAGTTLNEVSRATPVVPIIGGLDYIVQGTYQPTTGNCPVVGGDSDVGAFTFPCRVGHMRARLASAPTTVLFDAGCNAAAPGTLTQFACPSGSVGLPSTRTIFTNTAGGDLRNNPSAKVPFDSTLTTAMKNLIGLGTTLSTTSINTIISRVTAGYPNGSGGYFAALGGVDRSTVAVIQQSGVAGAARPMMAYFGASDGMLHAVCVEATGVCATPGVGAELWAFLPRKVLPYLRTNNAHIDGSPRVLDAYIDPDGAGSMTTQWRTVLVFHTSMGDYSQAGREPAIYALDITDPGSPRIMWEFSESSLGASSMGTGLTLSAGAATVSGAVKYLVWTDTNNFGTSGPGAVITAIDLATGAKFQQAFFAYPNPPRAVSTDDPVVYTGMPAGTVPLDLPSGNTGRISNVMFTDIYGRLWVLNATTLVSVNGSGVPLFNVGSNYRAMGNKPAVFQTSGSQYAVFTTGGYVDPTNTTWPMACCASSNGTSCDATQPVYGSPCAFNNNSTAIFPMQKALAVKLNTALTSSVTLPGSACDNSSTNDPVTGTNLPACTDTNVLFARDLGRDQRGASQALVIGTDIFLTTDSSNTNSALYGTSGVSTGHLFAFSTQGAQYGTAAAPSTAVIFGAAAPAASNGTGTRYAYAGGAGTFASGSTATSGSNVTTNPSAGVTRRLWLRTE